MRRSLRLCGRVCALGTLVLVAVLGSGGAGSSAATRSAAALPPGEGTTSSFCAGVTRGHNVTQGAFLVASFDGVWACGPPPHTGAPGYGDDFESAPWGFQCTELANRFLWAAYGLSPIFAPSLTGAVFATAFHNAHQEVALVPNGTTGVPYLPGDVVSFSDGGLGHVAIVTASSEDVNGNGKVDFMEENLWADGSDSAYVSHWRLGGLAHDSSLTPVNFLAPQHIVGAGGSGYLITNGNKAKLKMLYPPTRACIALGKQEGPDLGAVDPASIAGLQSGPSLSCADINHDGRVDSSDLSIEIANYGTTFAPPDLNGDGRVDIRDLSILLSHYGQNF